MNFLFLVLTLFAPTAKAQVNTQAFCEAFHFSDCPSLCTRKCIGSCPLCDNCDGPKSCVYQGKSEATFDINFQDKRLLGRTALMELLMKGGSLAQVEKLLSLGARLDLKDREGNTPILLARINTKNRDVINLLIKRGASIRDVNNAGIGIVSKASCEDHQIYPYLKSKGADLSQTSILGTSLSQCIRSCNLEGIKYLKSEGVPVPKDWKVRAKESNCAKAAQVL